MTRVSEVIQWKRVPIGAGAASGQIELAIGEVGRGGPVALISAGVHGDEGPWGAWAIHKLLDKITTDDLKGTLRIVPSANPLAMEADARNAPLDVLDLNRVFPGDANGSHTERLAAALVAHAVEGADVVIDLHGGGSWCVNAFVFRFPGGEALARAIGAPFVVDGPDRTVAMTGYARSKGASVCAVEMGGRSNNEEAWAERIASGLRRALGVAGVLTPGTGVARAAVPVGPSTVIRPSRGGVFAPQVRQAEVGTIVAKGTVLGYLLDPVTRQVLETFTAPFPKTAIMLLRPMLARVEGGAMLYVVAEPKK